MKVKHAKLKKVVDQLKGAVKAHGNQAKIVQNHINSLKKSPMKASEGKYYYKIGGKNVTKAEYNKYQNPIGDGPTKQTNDPDPSGRIARTQEARKKNTASKKATVLTKAQTKVKDQGTKVKKKPPFKVKVKLKGKKLPKGYTEKDKKFLEEQREDVVRREDLDEKGKKLYDKRQAQIKAKKKAKKKAPFKSKKDFKPHKMYKKGKKDVMAKTYEMHLELKKKGYSHTPLKNKFLNRVQTGLTVAGMVPGIGNLADMANTAVSAGRAGYAKYKGDEVGYKTHRNNAAINAAAMVPGAGLAVGGAKLAAKAAKGGKAAKLIKNAADTTTATNRVAALGSKAAKKAIVTGAKKGQEKMVASKSKTKPKPKTTITKKQKSDFAGKGPLKPKSTKPVIARKKIKTGLEGITGKKTA